jgi:hypothetical protein
MLRPSRINPKMSAYKAVHGPYDWNRFLLAPPGCKAVIYKAPELRGSWASHGTDAWYVGPSFDHYQCNHYFVPDTRAYHVSGLAKLFSQHCQVPFLLWNENFQEVIDELTTTLNELPPKQRTKSLTMVFKRLQLGQIDEPTLTLTAPTQAWMLPREDIQLNPYVTPPIKQRVPLPTTTIQRITDAPPIMNAPNSMQKQCLKLTKRTHSRRTRNNIPGSVPAITLTASWRFIPNPPTPTVVALRRFPRTTTPATPPPVDTRIPRKHFRPIEGGVKNRNLISQEAINSLTECVWANSPDVFTPEKLKPKSTPSCLDLDLGQMANLK